jgi:hypothetical protein
MTTNRAPRPSSKSANRFLTSVTSKRPRIDSGPSLARVNWLCIPFKQMARRQCLPVGPCDAARPFCLHRRSAGLLHTRSRMIPEISFEPPGLTPHFLIVLPRCRSPSSVLPSQAVPSYFQSQRELTCESSREHRLCLSFATRLAFLFRNSAFLFTRRLRSR